MSYDITLIDGSTLSDKTIATGYVVSDHGVLRTVEHADEKWIISSEYAPNAWIQVEGTRFDGDVKGAPGSDGKIVNGKYFP